MAMMMIGRARHTSPTPPGMNSNGTKATAEVRTANVSGALIRRTPRMAAATPAVPRLRSVLNVLGHHDGVVDDNPDGEDEGEEADRIDRHVECHHDGEGAYTRNDETHGNPQGKPDLEKQAECDQHQQQPQDPVLQKEIGALLVGLGFIVPHGDAHAVRQSRDHLVRQVLANRPGHIHHLLATGLVDLDEYGGPVLMADDQVCLLEPVADLGGVAEAHERAVAAAEQDDLLEVLLVVVLPEGPYSNLRFPGIYAARRQVERTAADRAGNVGQRESQGPQPVKRHLDGNLVIPDPADLDLGKGRVGP